MKHIPFFNGKSVCEEFSSIGIITTSDSYEPRSAEDLDYLSAHTVFLRGFAVPQYNRRKILTSLLYSNRKKHTPANALNRTCGMLVCGYTDAVLRKFLREVIAWLLLKYDRICHDDPEWMVAKMGILSDQRLFELWTGTSFFLPEQCVQSCTKDTGTKRTMSSPAINAKTSQPKRGGGAKATRIDFSAEEHEKYKQHLGKGVPKAEAKARILQSRQDKQLAIVPTHGQKTFSQRKPTPVVLRGAMVQVNKGVPYRPQVKFVPKPQARLRNDNGEVIGKKKKKKNTEKKSTQPKTHTT